MVFVVQAKVEDPALAVKGDATSEPNTLHPHQVWAGPVCFDLLYSKGINPIKYLYVIVTIMVASTSMHMGM